MMLEGAKDGLWFWDLKKDIYQVTFQDMEIIPKEIKLGEESVDSWKDLIHPEDIALVNENIESFLKHGEGIYENTFRIKGKNDKYHWIYSRGVGKTDEEGNIIQLAGSHTDITQQVELNDKLFKMAYYDALTELPNGQKARNHFTDIINGYESWEETSLAFIYVDIDHFSYINNTRGYEEGNQVLREMADFLRVVLGSKVFVARVSADEFVIILENYWNEAVLREKIQRYIKTFGKTKFGRAKDLSLTCTVGVAIYPKNGMDYDSLIQRANIALYSAKKNGKNQCMFYKEEMSEKAYRLIDQMQQIKKGIENEEFHMVYQPIVEVPQGMIQGLEALIRWNHPFRGFVSPGEFIPVAEESKQIVAIERWILEEVHRQCAQWKKEEVMPEFISINLSGRGLIEINLIETLRDLGRRYEIFPEEIELEITETAVMNCMNRAVEVLEQLKALGYRLALDDFGTGYSSLNYLNQLPFDRVKLDRSFINDIDCSERQQFIVKAIITLCHNLETEVIAEGVERETQQVILEKMHCNYIQGYLHGRPEKSIRGRRYLSHTSLSTTQ
nr:EAL domain-containing protein [Isachenkonia alkalipeptolytica]